MPKTEQAAPMSLFKRGLKTQREDHRGTEDELPLGHRFWVFSCPMCLLIPRPYLAPAGTVMGSDRLCTPISGPHISTAPPTPAPVLPTGKKA